MKMIIAIAFILALIIAIYIESKTAVWQEYVTMGNLREYRCTNCGERFMQRQTAYRWDYENDCMKGEVVELVLPRKCPSCGKKMRRIRQ